MKRAGSLLAAIQDEIINCNRCPRLREHCSKVAKTKRRAYLDWTYWGRPVPSFGDPAAKLMIIGLAPGAHGANRTGRMFTGDRSGDYLYRALHLSGYASQAQSTSSGAGLALKDCVISAAVHCAPPRNKPSRQEIKACRHYLVRELAVLKEVRVIVALGRLAFNVYLSILRDQGHISSRAAFLFGHNVVQEPAPGRPWLISSYHPSQQNTSTGRLTDAMLLAVFQQARRLGHTTD